MCTPHSEARRGKSPRETRVEMIELVLPNDANTMGNVLGGRVLHWIDLAAAIVAHRHCRTEAVTASMDDVSFLGPIRVDVQSEDLMSGARRQTSTAYLTFVAVDDKGRPTDVPPLLLETEDEKREARAAEGRRDARLQARGPAATTRETKQR